MVALYVVSIKCHNSHSDKEKLVSTSHAVGIYLQIAYIILTRAAYCWLCSHSQCVVAL